jgi:hypothetical protein
MCVLDLSCSGVRIDRLSALRRVLDLKLVTQCAMLDDCGIFLVLADGVRRTFSCRCLLSLIRAASQSLFAYDIEALLPSSMQSAPMSQTPQKLSGAKHVEFFSVGSLEGSTLVAHMQRKGTDSIFRVFKHVVGLEARFGPPPQWFRVTRERTSLNLSEHKP